MAINCIESMNNTVIPELAWKALAHADSVMLGPFQLSLSDTTERLYCNEIIRIIPGKRLVALGTWDGKEVVAKLFYGHGKAKRHLKRDVLGIDALVQANIPTPRILYKGSAPNRRIQVILFEKINQAKNLETIWQEQKNSVAFEKLMRKVIVELATQHVLGILQRDLHLKNFLATEKRIYTLDGGGIEKFPDILDKNQSMENLSWFFAQLGVGTEHLQRALFKIYAESRGWIVKQADFNFLKASVIRKNKERWMRYRKKIMRTCTSFVRINKLNQSIIYDRAYQSDALLDLFHNPEKFFTQPDISFLKRGRSATVAKIRLDSRTLVVKRYNIKNGWHWLRRCFRATRAATSWRLSQRLRLFGVSTAKPVGYVENRFFGLRGKSYFVMEYIEGQTIGDFFSSRETEEKPFTNIAEMIVKILNHLGELKITHGDLKMTNILLADNQLLLIDLDGMREHATMLSFKWAFKKEIERFMKNWEHHPKIFALFKTLLFAR